MNVLDRAITTATRLHSGVLRKGSSTPYILHPLEAAAICATMTDDLEVLAAAVLHDTLEDTAYTLPELTADFGPHIAALVATETEDKRPGQDPASTWRTRKEEAVRHLAAEPRVEVKILVLGDKLSNLRAIYRAKLAQGDGVWSRFHQKDPLEHCWYYREMGAALGCLCGCPAWAEYWWLYRQIWPSQPIPEQGAEGGRSDPL